MPKLTGLEDQLRLVNVNHEKRVKRMRTQLLKDIKASRLRAMAERERIMARHLKVKN